MYCSPCSSNIFVANRFYPFNLGELIHRSNDIKENIAQKLRFD